MRQSYRCDCVGALPVGRVSPSATRGVRLAVYEWTGEASASCAWRAFRDPFVARVLDAYRWFESGQVATFAPRASHRLVEGIGFYHRALNICQGKHMDLDREEAKKSRGRDR